MRKRKSHTLPTLQSDILLYLAETGSQTKNEIASGVSRSYKPTWTAFNNLKMKKFIKETDIKTYHGREYPQFWLSDDGTVIALAEGADPDRLLELTKQIYPENQTLACYLEVLSKMNPDIVKKVYSALRVKGKLEPIDIVTVMITEMQSKAKDQSLKDIIDTLKAYPKEYDLFKKRMDKILEGLDKLKEMT